MIIIGECLRSIRKPVREALERRLGDSLEAEALRHKEAGGVSIDLFARDRK
jgi:hypothetical protein